jgi:hypothetical protein
MSEPVAVTLPSKPTLERIRIKRANGEVIDLGKPDTLMFKFKLWAYKRRIAKEQQIG